MSDVVIRVESLGKLYRIGAQERYKTFRDTLTETFTKPFCRLRTLFSGNGASPADSPDNTFWALKDVSFEVKRGKVIGIIGRNGAGKSTLLKILSRITEPTEGFAKIRGRVGSLLEVGTGFHPELTGRENIYLNGAILGMHKSEINQKFDEIVAFAEVERFIDTPVKHYSNGMYLRLAFSVAAHLEPEILLVDEVLAVGDAAFQQKCLGKMDDVAKEGRTVLLVSHNMAAIQNLCNSSILLNNGQIVEAGSTLQVIRKYQSLIDNTIHTPLNIRNDRKGSGILKFTNFYVSTSSKDITNIIFVGDNVVFTIEYTSENSHNLRNVSVAIAIYNAFGQNVCMLGTKMVGKDFTKIFPSGKFHTNINKFPIMPGRYSLNLYCAINGILSDSVKDAATISVIEGDFFGTGFLPWRSHGDIIIDHDWNYLPK